MGDRVKEAALKALKEEKKALKKKAAKKGGKSRESDSDGEEEGETSDALVKYVSTCCACVVARVYVCSAHVCVQSARRRRGGDRA